MVTSYQVAHPRPDELLERSVLRDRHSMTLVGLNSGLTITNETAITKEGYRRLRNDSESHTTSLLDNRERNYRQSSVIVCSLLIKSSQDLDGSQKNQCQFLICPTL